LKAQLKEGLTSFDFRALTNTSFGRDSLKN